MKNKKWINSTEQAGTFSPLFYNRSDLKIVGHYNLQTKRRTVFCYDECEQQSSNIHFLSCTTIQIFFSSVGFSYHVNMLAHVPGYWL